MSGSLPARRRHGWVRAAVKAGHRGAAPRHPVFFGPASKPRLKAAAHWDHRTRAYCSSVPNSAAHLASAIASRGVPKGASLRGIAYNLPSVAHGLPCRNAMAKAYAGWASGAKLALT